ncbi:HD-GYP domain-containing protein, partial [Chloroflexota bacterium]
QCLSGIQPSLDYTEVSYIDSQEDKSLNSVYALAAVVDARHYYNRSHWRKVKETVTVMAKAISMEPANIERLQTCALLHDIGKIVIPDKLINKRGRLSAEEWEVIKSHPQVGANIVGHNKQLACCIPSILHHHERYDGSGYPAGIKGEDIPLDARIIAIADSFAAMTSDRSYSDALTPQMALREIKQRSGVQFDPSLVEVFASCVEDRLLLPQERKPV